MDTIMQVLAPMAVFLKASPILGALCGFVGAFAFFVVGHWAMDVPPNETRGYRSLHFVMIFLGGAVAQMFSDKLDTMALTFGSAAIVMLVGVGLVRMIPWPTRLWWSK